MKIINLTPEYYCGFSPLSSKVALEIASPDWCPGKEEKALNLQPIMDDKPTSPLELNGSSVPVL